MGGVAKICDIESSCLQDYDLDEKYSQEPPRRRFNVQGTMFTTAPKLILKPLERFIYPSTSPLTLLPYTNVDWIRDPTNGRSTIGLYFRFGDSLIHWCNK